MRINKFVASSSGLSRRAADQAILDGRILVNGKHPQPGQDVTAADAVSLDGRALTASVPLQTIMLNKPVGYVVSRSGQGSHQTIYDILPPEYHHLKPVGRLDKYSSGLLLLTNDGVLAQHLTHPSHQKTKVYQVVLSKPLTKTDERQITGPGVPLEDGSSRLALAPLKADGRTWQITMREGRNRQIRRTFLSLGYGVTTLHRTHLGEYALDDLVSGQMRATSPSRA